MLSDESEEYKSAGSGMPMVIGASAYSHIRPEKIDTKDLIARRPVLHLVNR